MPRWPVRALRRGSKCKKKEKQSLFLDGLPLQRPPRRPTHERSGCNERWRSALLMQGTHISEAWTWNPRKCNQSRSQETLIWL